MAGGVSGDGHCTPGVFLLNLVQEVICPSGGTTAGDLFKKDCTDLDGAVQKIEFHFKYVAWKLEKALGNLPCDGYEISEEVQEQVELVRARLRRAAKKYGPPSSMTPSDLSQLLNRERITLLSDQRSNGDDDDDDVTVKMDTFCNSHSLV